jgi:ligand-binding sensor domain-containing protein
VRYFKKYIAFVLFALTGYGQLMGQKLRFERFTVEDGLQNNIVLAAAADAKGLLWFATSTGIDRFDGSNFVHYALPQNSPNASYGQLIGLLVAKGIVDKQSLPAAQ